MVQEGEKTNYLIRKTMTGFIILSLFFCCNVLKAQNSEEPLKIEFNLVDEANQPVIYAHVRVKSGGSGVVSDTSGLVQMLTSRSLLEDSVEISSIGFKKQILAVKDAMALNKVQLNRDTTVLNTTVVAADKTNPTTIIGKAINRFNERSHNYSNSGAYIIERNVLPSGDTSTIHILANLPEEGFVQKNITLPELGVIASRKKISGKGHFIKVTKVWQTDKALDLQPLEFAEFAAKNKLKYELVSIEYFNERPVGKIAYVSEKHGFQIYRIFLDNYDFYSIEMQIGTPKQHLKKESNMYERMYIAFAPDNLNNEIRLSNSKTVRETQSELGAKNIEISESTVYINDNHFDIETQSIEDGQSIWDHEPINTDFDWQSVVVFGRSE